MLACWRTSTGEADWIAERLSLLATSVISMVPAGFFALARILHPTEEPRASDRLVR